MVIACTDVEITRPGVRKPSEKIVTTIITVVLNLIVVKKVFKL